MFLVPTIALLKKRKKAKLEAAAPAKADATTADAAPAPVENKAVEAPAVEVVGETTTVATAA